ncbi:reverse transcriptase domain-containing protein [Blastomonas natatoria]|uniref:reverse transcriptase domain-containing protein n=1 Tax=Blastomonas natatoria TaxID=34015 RepID=UPI00142D8A41|nr:reverse transcriptase domain-containing protein [Blastomonas natatoria]
MSTRAKSIPGQYRAIYEFGSIDAARQRLIRSSLDPFVDFHPSQFMLRQTGQGRGRSAVSKSLLSQLPRLTSDHVFVQMDVTKFYQSVSHSWLEDNLPLPKDIIRSQVHVGGMAVFPVRDNVAARLGIADSGAFEMMVRQGLPTGSALSPLVAEFVMSKVLGELADRHAASMSGLFVPSLHAYSDNLGIFVRQTEVDAIVDLVRGAFASSAAGPFEVTAARPI